MTVPIVPGPQPVQAATPPIQPRRGLSQGWIAALILAVLLSLGVGYLLLGGIWPPRSGPGASVTVERCAMSPSGIGQADLVVQNTTSRTHTYTITVVFETSGTQVGSGLVTVRDLQSGQVARDRAAGSVSLTNFACRVSSVDSR